jgi:IclR family acetate operon transcriptional repressor
VGVRCVGAPVHDGPGPCRAAVAVQAPALRMPTQRFADVGPDVVQAAKEIAALLPPGHSF